MTNHIILPTTDFLDTVRPTVEKALQDCEKNLPTNKNVRIILQYTEDKFVSEKMNGSAGSTEDEESMTIKINTNTSAWKDGVRASVAHEYNHVVWHQIHGKDWQTVTLGELLVMGGLAQHFEEQLTGKRPLWSTAVSEEKTEEIFKTIKEHLQENGPEWWQNISFENSDKYPLWSGYALAYVIIKRQLEKRGDVSWPDIMHMKSQELLKLKTFGL